MRIANIHSLKMIPNTDNQYAISADGKVFSLWRRKASGSGEPYIMPETIRVKTQMKDNGYESVKIKPFNKLETYYIHRLVAEAFVPNPHGYKDVDHKDGNKMNNIATNLEWVTRSENLNRASKQGKMAKRKVKGKPKRQEICHRLDQLCQTCARYRGGFKRNGEWLNTCVSCGKVCKIGGQGGCQGGHLWGRSCYPLRWEEKNVNCQCVFCNCFLHGNEREYAKWFIEKFGNEVYDGLDATAKAWRRGAVRPFTIMELCALYNSWLLKGRKIEEMTGLKLFPKTWDYIDMEKR